MSRVYNRVNDSTVWQPPLLTPTTQQVYCESTCETGDERCMPANYSSSQTGPLWPHWDVCVACPLASASKLVCNGHGTCHASQSRGVKGFCACHGGWTGSACTSVTDHTIVDCAGELTPTEEFEYHNPSSNSLQLTSCFARTECQSSAQVCSTPVAPHSTVTLVLPASSGFLQAQYCVEVPPAGHARLDSCTEYIESYVKDTSNYTWTPALSAQSSDAAFCAQDTDCPSKVRRGAAASGFLWPRQHLASLSLPLGFITAANLC